MRAPEGCSRTVFTMGVGGLRERWGGVIPQPARKRVSECPLGTVSHMRPTSRTGMIPGRRIACISGLAGAAAPQPGDQVRRWPQGLHVPASSNKLSAG